MCIYTSIVYMLHHLDTGTTEVMHKIFLEFSLFLIEGPFLIVFVVINTIKSKLYNPNLKKRLDLNIFCFLIAVDLVIYKDIPWLAWLGA